MLEKGEFEPAHHHVPAGEVIVRSIRFMTDCHAVIVVDDGDLGRMGFYGCNEVLELYV